ncbi:MULTISPECIES: hypothetical protein [Lactiplantibacillus]|uniref:Uncharacterized protein n=2 Tax=Lactiplantibacillus paraplantarum TaxID=60520 RepID=A0AAD0X7Z1_9LACO|nr:MULTISPECIES: hypothetical protein [Lactiplantibacillus]AYJ38861.1 hypothetical protein LP667_08545 [Lactiplantibacillus paraplantarum]AYJ38915.1 hypothetical protein LP667_08840 [Lactiplantibacillus paraplantarum]MCU4683952.1 hypothetical protein [Lactiplantibacillus paraplantarum]MDL2061112.1 hypothetical protein [Lactiplantibacillus paraplantarum]MDV0430107.1 hypothetical protein [Lactiplantibacillus sp. DA1]
MINITTINHGQANWDEPLNRMLEGLGSAVEDTGWIDLTLINGFENRANIGKTSIRKIGEIVVLRLSITNLVRDAVIAKLPTNFYPQQSIPFSLRGTIGRSFSLTLGNDGNLNFESPMDGQFDVTDYVGGTFVWVTG